MSIQWLQFPQNEIWFFCWEDETIITYDMDRIKVYVIYARVFRYGRRSVKPFYLPYVLLFLNSLAEQ
jgi:hypothetical protein